MTIEGSQKRSEKRVPEEAKIVGANLRYLREANGFSLQELGEILGISYQQIQKYEQGKNRLPVENLHRLKNFYDVPYDIFFRGLADAEGDPLQVDLPDVFLYTRLGNLKDRKLQKKIETIIRVLLS